VAGVRSMLGRVAKLEQGRTAALSPIALAFGSFDAFATWAEERIAAGELDPLDFPIIVTCLRRWEVDGTWGQRWGNHGKGMASW
jgi:hypothetical protein